MEKPNYELANCRDKPLDMFFPGQGEMTVLRAAVAVCNGCVIREECLEDNLDAHWGVVGGTSERERRRIRASRSNLRILDI